MLMCIQVLICPVLCADGCGRHDLAQSSVTQAKASPKTCRCCPNKELDAEHDRGGDSRQPCDHSTCGNCFCSGALPLADGISELLTSMIFVTALPVDRQHLTRGDCQVPSRIEHLSDFTELYGRGLLRAHCILLI